MFNLVYLIITYFGRVEQGKEKCRAIFIKDSDRREFDRLAQQVFSNGGKGKGEWIKVVLAIAPCHHFQSDR